MGARPVTRSTLLRRYPHSAVEVLGGYSGQCFQILRRQVHNRKCQKNGSGDCWRGRHRWDHKLDGRGLDQPLPERMVSNLSELKMPFRFAMSQHSTKSSRSVLSDPGARILYTHLGFEKFHGKRTGDAGRNPNLRDCSG